MAPDVQQVLLPHSVRVAMEAGAIVDFGRLTNTYGVAVVKPAQHVHERKQAWPRRPIKKSSDLFQFTDVEQTGPGNFAACCCIKQHVNPATTMQPSSGT